MTIGDRIRIKRKAMGLTQLELAHKMGYKDKTSISKMESGENDIPQSKVVKLAGCLNCSVAYLMGWESNEDNLDAELASLMGKMMSADDKTKNTVRKVLMLNAEQIAMLDKVVNAMLEG